MGGQIRLDQFRWGEVRSDQIKVAMNASWDYSAHDTDIGAICLGTARYMCLATATEALLCVFCH